MNPHVEAWQHVKAHLYGTVCEVALRTPWGFVVDDDTITNVTVDDFLSSTIRYDTIILHILSGENETQARVERVIQSALERCIKLVILEHNPESDDFDGLRELGFIDDLLCDKEVIYEDWGRNVLYACTTFDYLQLPELSDEYFRDNIDVAYVKPDYDGIDKELLIYTHTSEQNIDFELPSGVIYWVIGGGFPYENMMPSNVNILIDSVLRQVLHCAHYFEPGWKIERLYPLPRVTAINHGDSWRVVKPNGVKPYAILHKSLTDLKSGGNTIYVSTVHIDAWWRLMIHNHVIDAWTVRNEPVLRTNPFI
jgi:hypothetical protein